MTVPTLTGPATGGPGGIPARPALGTQLLRRKPIAQMVSEAEDNGGGPRLVRSFGVLQLTMISVGATLGTGILVILGESVPLAGPAIWISFAIAIRRLVSPAMAEGTTTMSWPIAFHRATRRATLRMRSMVPTEVPPNFWTIKAM